MKSFDFYLIMIGIRSIDFDYTDEQLRDNTSFFKECFEQGLSAYKALLFLRDNLKLKEK